MSDRDAFETSMATASAFGKGLVHGAFESPINATLQLANHGLEASTGNKLGLIDVTGLTSARPQTRCEQTAAEFGQVVGAVLPLYVINKCTGRLFNTSMAAEKTADVLGSRTLGATLGRNAVQGAVTGAIYGTLLTPSEDGDFGDLVRNRLKNGVLTSATFSAFQTANALGRYELSRNGVFGSMNRREFLTRELPMTTAVGAMAGIPAGLVQSNLNAGLNEGRSATADEMIHDVGTNMLFGGGFAALHQAQMRSIKAAPLTEQQKSQIRWAERTDGQSGDWEPMYKELFPPEEAQDIDVLKNNFIGENNTDPIAQADRPSTGQPRMTIHETYAPNGKLLAASINEVYPGRPEIAGEKGFILGAYTFVHPEMQSTGVGAHHLGKGVIPALRADYPAQSWQGRVTEIESTDGLTSADQPVRRAYFYRDKIGMEGFDKDKVPYELPLFQPEDAREAGTYIPQREIPGDGPVPAEMLYTPFDGEPVTGTQARGIYDRLARWGYGVHPDDPYLPERIEAIDANAENVRGPIVLNPEQVELSARERAMKGVKQSVPYQEVKKTVASDGTAGGAQQRNELDER